MAIASVGPLTVPVRSSVPPEAVTVPVPDRFAVTVPEAGQRRAGADGHAGRIDQRAAVESRSCRW